jgi:hypothetical protein
VCPGVMVRLFCNEQQNTSMTFSFSPAVAATVKVVVDHDFRMRWDEARYGAPTVWECSESGRLATAMQRRSH